MAHPDQSAQKEKRRNYPTGVALRNGAWYAGERRCGSYHKAILHAFRAAEIELPRSEPGERPRTEGSL
jgi:hypothetical protein